MHFLLECQRFIEFIRERNPKNAIRSTFKLFPCTIEK